MTTESFRSAYAALEDRMRAQANADGHPYVPNVEPTGPVQWILVAMEPSFGDARSLAKAKADIAAGVRNFLPTGDVGVLRWAARRYLCGPGERYHITDISKGAMLPDDADGDREARWNRWHPLLVEEINLVGPGAGIIALGKHVLDHLQEHSIPCSLAIHYSSIAGNGRKVFMLKRQAEFDAFNRTLHHQDIVEEAIRVLDESGVSERWRAQTLREISLTESRRWLAFRYSVEFEKIARAAPPSAA